MIARLFELGRMLEPLLYCLADQVTTSWIDDPAMLALVFC